MEYAPASCIHAKHAISYRTTLKVMVAETAFSKTRLLMPRKIQARIEKKLDNRFHRLISSDLAVRLPAVAGSEWPGTHESGLIRQSMAADRKLIFYGKGGILKFLASGTAPVYVALSALGAVPAEGALLMMAKMSAIVNAGIVAISAALYEFGRHMAKKTGGSVFADEKNKAAKSFGYLKANRFALSFDALERMYVATRIFTQILPGIAGQAADFVIGAHLAYTIGKNRSVQGMNNAITQFSEAHLALDGKIVARYKQDFGAFAQMPNAEKP